MALPVPNLDDRRFQDLVDEAKRLVQQRCPEWTDHNVSDPGVTLIELFAWMTDQVVYRLNRVPDRNYVKFLELIGVSLFPPTAARTSLTFWLSAPQPDTVTIAAGTQAATVRTDTSEAIAFTTTEDLPIVPSSLERLGSMIDGKTLRDHWGALEKGTEFACFQPVPKPGDALYIGLSEAVPSNAVRLRFKADIEGVGVDPTNPPLAWEAWTGDDWEPCELDSDTTGGLNRDGDVVIHVPRAHVVSLIAKQRGGWIRARVTQPVEGQPAYSASPNIKGLTAITIGGTVDAVNAELVYGEEIGISDGVPGQRFPVKRGPIVPGDGAAVLEVTGAEGWDEWTHVGDFAASGPDDMHFVLDLSSGEVRLGPAVRLADGAFRRYGAVPPKGAHLRLREYRVGGGRRGNVATRSISVMKSSIPFVARVENRRPARGGVDGEDIENAKVRGPIRLRARGRAVADDMDVKLEPRGGPGGRPRAGRGRGRRRRRRLSPGAHRALRGVRAGPPAVRPAGAQRGHPPEDHRPARGEPGHRDPGDHRAARVPRHHRGRQAQGPQPGQPQPAPGGGAGRPVRVLQPDHRRPRRDRLAVRAPGERRRGLLGAPGDPRDRAGRGRAAVRRRPGDRPARPADAAPGARGPRPRVQLRAPGARRGRVMRGLVAGLGTPHPLGPALPALYQDDDFAQRLLAGLDDVMAPIYSTLDNFDAYLDPHLTPDDFLAWLGGWVGIALDESWDVERRRAIVGRAVDLYRMRGTALGLAGQVEIQTGGHVEIVENGATGWSVDPGGELPGSPEPLVVVRVTVPDPKGVDAQRLDALVATAKPAHVMHRIEIVKGGGAAKG